jgi:hypothetical protein
LIINSHIHKPANAISVTHEIIASMVIVLLINVRRRCFLAAKRTAITHHIIAIYQLYSIDCGACRFAMYGCMIYEKQRSELATNNPMSTVYKSIFLILSFCGKILFTIRT